MIIHWNHLPILPSMDGITIGPVSFIRSDAPLSVEKHELVHQAQFKSDWLMPVKYLLSKSARYRYELEAYKVSIVYGLPLESAVNYIHDCYNLGILDTKYI